jgi:TolB-like protein/class 3 adenylate cyclase/Flp pilus assembly protein TadD
MTTRKLAAILAADVAGYSRLAGADEERTLARLRALRGDLIDPAIEAHHGRVVKRTGDGILVEFRSVVDAVRCALEVQNGMTERNAGVAPDRKIEFRVGIHLGDVVEESDGDLMGDGVNIAARLESIAEPGGICLSRAAQEQVEGKIDLSFTDLGERELKNIARPVRVFAIGPQKSPSPPQWGGEGRDEVGKSPNKPTSPSHAFGAGPSLSPQRVERGNPPRLSIVVLPFANIGGDPEQEYFVDGVTESLTTDLSRISGSFVIGRNTAFTYKGKPFDVKQIGRELNVRYVLEGSVQRGGNRMRVNVQFIDAESGNHLWAERFDKPIGDLFDMQDEIVARLANTLNAHLIAAEARRAERNPHADSLDLYFQGMAWLNKGLTPEYLERAKRFFDHALALDAINVGALVGRGIVDTVVGATLYGSDRASRALEAEAVFTKALSIAPEHPLAHAGFGWLLIATNRAARGIAECERALGLDRNLALAHATIGLAYFLNGRCAETEACINEALRLSPRDANAYLWMAYAGCARAYLGANEDGVAWFHRGIETNRNFPSAHFWLAATLANLGRLDEARAEVSAGLALDPTFTVGRFRTGAASDHPTFLAQREQFVLGMRRAGVPEG